MSNDVVLVSSLLALYIVLANSVDSEQVIAGCAESLIKVFVKKVVL